MNHNTSFQQLAVFHVIASEGSIRAAARKLGISVPAVSKSLRLLESTLGTSLFKRTTRAISLTDAGKQLLQQTQPALDTLYNALDNVREDGLTAAGTIRLTLSQIAFQTILQPIYAEFCRQYPCIRLDVSIDNGLNHLVGERFDLGIRFSDAVEDGMVAHALTSPMQEGLFVSSGYAREHGTPQTLAELAQHRLIGYRFTTSNRLHPLLLDYQGKTKSIDMPLAIVCNDTNMVADAIRQGIGIGRMFTIQHKTLLKNDDFIPILQAHWRTFPQLHLYYLRGARSILRLNLFIDFLLEKTATGLNDCFLP